MHPADNDLANLLLQEDAELEMALEARWRRAEERDEAWFNSYRVGGDYDMEDVVEWVGLCD